MPEFFRRIVASNFARGTLAAVGLAVLIVVLSALGNALAERLFPKPGFSDEVDDSSAFDSGVEYEGCNVAGINLHGELWTYLPADSSDQLIASDQVSSDYIMEYLDVAENTPEIKAILLEVDSGGGSPVAGEEIADGLKRSKKPTVGLIRDIGASASYWAVSGAEKIFASLESNVGSIGVTSSFLETASPGDAFISLSAGKYKDAGNPDKPMTADEKALYMRDVNKIYENFIRAVSENRHLPVEKVRALADGSTMLGDAAREAGLVDEIGNLYDVHDYLEKKLGEPVRICWN